MIRYINGKPRYPRDYKYIQSAKAGVYICLPSGASRPRERQIYARFCRLYIFAATREAGLPIYSFIVVSDRLIAAQSQRELITSIL